jgi:transcriptional regulator with XRE-family HTH domain
MDDAKNPAKEEFGLLLKAARTRLNLQHQDIVRMIGEANTQQVSNWERGLILPHRRRVEKLFDALPGINRARMWELWIQEENRKIRLREESRTATLDAKRVTGKAPKPPRLGKQLEPIEPTGGQTPVPKGHRVQGRRRQAS